MNRNGIGLDVGEEVEGGERFSMKMEFKGEGAKESLNDLRGGIYGDGGRQLGTLGTE